MNISCIDKKKEKHNENHLKNENFEEHIKIILTQTNYTRNEAIDKLKIWNNNYINVIKEYINPNFNSKKTTKKQTNNQNIFSEIRKFMDSVNLKK